MENMKHEKQCAIHDVIPRLLCRVEWYTGDVTKEIITGETDEMYIFDYKKNHSYYAPKQWCEVLNVV